MARTYEPGTRIWIDPETLGKSNRRGIVIHSTGDLVFAEFPQGKMRWVRKSLILHTLPPLGKKTSR